LDPQGAEAVEEVCLAGYGAVVHVCVAQFSDVDLRDGKSVQVSQKAGVGKRRLTVS